MPTRREPIFGTGAGPLLLELLAGVVGVCVLILVLWLGNYAWSPEKGIVRLPPAH
jgi:hypothetical protein